MAPPGLAVDVGVGSGPIAERGPGPQSDNEFSKCLPRVAWGPRRCSHRLEPVVTEICPSGMSLSPCGLRQGGTRPVLRLLPREPRARRCRSAISVPATGDGSSQPTDRQRVRDQEVGWIRRERLRPVLLWWYPEWPALRRGAGRIEDSPTMEVEDGQVKQVLEHKEELSRGSAVPPTCSTPC